MLAKSGSLPWNEKLSARANPIQTALETAAADRLAAAVHGEATRRMADFLAGIRAYRHHPYRRDLIDPAPLWTGGSANLRDYGGAGRPVLIVPSLINRAYILDLNAGNSLMRDMTARGWRPLLMDWGAPGRAEAGFDLDAYIMGYLADALDAAVALAGRPVPVVGYCMGGLLALALARHRAHDIASLALLATPWDFHGDRAGQGGLFALAAPQVEAARQQDGLIPIDVLQTMFAAMSPNLIQAKFRRFAAMDPASPDARDFVALEDWLNDGVALTGPVGRDCLSGWYGLNLPGSDLWRIGGSAIVPEEIDLPALVAVPRRDHIVPPQSARPLAERLPRARLLEPAAGHIGMVIGHRARTELWDPLDAWLRETA
jgi:polyhydroxyalkanoate synthase